MGRHSSQHEVVCFASIRPTFGGEAPDAGLSAAGSGAWPPALGATAGSPNRLSAIQRNAAAADAQAALRRSGLQAVAPWVVARRGMRALPEARASQQKSVSASSRAAQPPAGLQVRFEGMGGRKREPRVTDQSQVHWRAQVWQSRLAQRRAGSRRRQLCLLSFLLARLLACPLQLI